MATKRGARTLRSSKKSSPKKKRIGKKRSAKTAPANDRFVRDLLVRGEAVKIGRRGKLPPEATHVITKTNPDGTVEVRRARFKIF